MILSLKEFKDIINDLKEFDNTCLKMDELASNICKDFPPLNLFGLASKHTNIILKLLKNIFKDEGDWISYWIYELDYGKKYSKESVTNTDGSQIILKSPEDLYRFLMVNIKEKDNGNSIIR